MRRPSTPPPVNGEAHPGPIFVDPDEIAERLVKALGLRSKRAHPAIEAARRAVCLAGPTVIARAVATELACSLSAARRLMGLLLEITGGDRK